MDETVGSTSQQASLEPSPVQSVSSFVAHNIARRMLELAEVDAARYFAFKDRHDRLFSPPYGTDDFILLARLEAQIRTRLDDALNTLTEYGLNAEEIVVCDTYSHLARFTKTRKMAPH